MPFSLRDKVTKELENVIQKGIFECDTQNEQCILLLFLKKSGRIRICGDHRSTANEAVNQFFLPTSHCQKNFNYPV